MGVTAICDQGYVLARCRCPEQHGTPRRLPCEHKDHLHSQRWTGEQKELDVNEAFSPPPDPQRADPDDVRVCERCSVLHFVTDFRGGVCGWCADDLDAQERRYHPQDAS